MPTAHDSTWQQYDNWRRPLKKVEYDHGAYQIAYWMVSWDTARISLPGDDPRDLTATDITANGLHLVNNSEVNREYDCTKPLIEMLTECHNKSSRNHLRTVFQLKCQTNIPEAYQMTTEKPMDVLPNPTSEIAKRSRPRNHYSYHQNDLHRETFHRDTASCRIKICGGVHMQCTKRLLESRSMFLARWAWPPTVKLVY